MTALNAAFDVLLLAYAIAVVVVLIGEDRDPTTTLAWLLVLLLLPGVGLVLYFLFGRDWKARTRGLPWVREYREIAAKAMTPFYDLHAEQERAVRERYRSTPAERVVASIEAENGARPLPATSFRLFTTGEEKFAALKADLVAAERFIHLEYFIWERDELTADVTRILLQCLRDGVEVRIVYDWLGSLRYGKDELRALKAAGAQVAADAADLRRVNYRNHRKITVIDGEIGYTGGMNLGQEYVDGGSRFPLWRDTHVRYTGPAVAELEKWFASRWYELRRESLMAPRYLPEPNAACGLDATMLHLVASGVEDEWESARRTHGIAISGAEESVWIQSPYFVPDPGTYDALIGAALGGVDVRFMMTGWPDKRVAFRAAQSYWRPLVASGGHVYVYEAGFFHPKTIVVDGKVSAVGTMNLDVRSLRLHKELMVWVYDEAIARHQANVFEDDMTRCREVTLAELDAFGRRTCFVNSACRLASNLL